VVHEGIVVPKFPVVHLAGKLSRRIWLTLKKRATIETVA